MMNSDFGTGSICIVGHPANGITAIKKLDGYWHVIPTDDNESSRILSVDDYRACRVIYNPKNHREF